MVRDCLREWSGRGNPQRYYQNRQNAVEDTSRNGCRWTPEEIEVALDPTLTAVEAGRRLRRSFSAVANLRKRVGTGRSRGQHGGSASEG